MSLFGKAIAFLRKRGGPIAVEVVVNFIAPLVIYDHSVARLGEVGALMASSVPPILWSLVEFARHRRVDAISILVLSGIVLSLLLYLGGGSAHVLQLREKLVTVLIGVAFVVSVLIDRPLIYVLATASMKRNPDSADALADFERRRDDAGFKRVMRVMTLFWGIGLICEAGVAALLVMKLSVHDYLLFGPIVGYSFVGLMILWSALYVRTQLRRGAARRAAEAAKAAASAD